MGRGIDLNIGAQHGSITNVDYQSATPLMSDGSMTGLTFIDIDELSIGCNVNIVSEIQVEPLQTQQYVLH